MSTATELPYQHHRLTVADYHRMGEVGILSQQDRVELIEGELVLMAPIGSNHAGTVNYLSNLIRLVVGSRAIVSVQNPVFFGPYSEPEPDIALLKPREDFYRRAHPNAGDVLLIIEVADTSLRYDREFKIPLYSRHGIAESWLVDIENRLLQIYREPQPSGYQEQESFSQPQTHSPILLPDCAFDLTALF